MKTIEKSTTAPWTATARTQIMANQLTANLILPTRRTGVALHSIAAACCLFVSAALNGCQKAEDDAAAGKAHAGEASKESGGDGHKHGGEEAHADEVKLTAEAIERYGIKVEAAQMWALRPTIVTPARVGFNTEAMAHVGSPLRGRVVDIKARLGQDVKRGDALCIIESPELGEAQADLLQKRVAKETAGPVVDLAKSSWDRAKGLYDQTQGTTLTEVQRREAEYKAAVAAQRSADAAATAAENRLHLLGMGQEAVNEFLKTGEVAPRYAIRAAIDGQVVQREVTLGELVSPDREAIMVLANLANVWVLADVPESKLVEISVGAKAWITVGSSESKPLEGQVAYISSMVDMTTRTAQVRLEVATKDLPLKPGMFAQVEIVTSTGGSDPTPVVAVPDVAVQTVEGGPAVFVPVPGEPNTFAKRAVTIGKSVGGLVPIYSGLVDGEQFVAAGTFILKADLGKGSAAHEH